jgi:hypothetical protein
MQEKNDDERETDRSGSTRISTKKSACCKVLRVPTDTPPGNAPHADMVAHLVRPMAGGGKARRA